MHSCREGEGWLGSPLQECGSRAQRLGGCVFGTRGERLKGDGGHGVDGETAEYQPGSERLPWKSRALPGGTADTDEKRTLLDLDVRTIAWIVKEKLRLMEALAAAGGGSGSL